MKCIIENIWSKLQFFVPIFKQILTFYGLQNLGKYHKYCFKSQSEGEWTCSWFKRNKNTFWAKVLLRQTTFYQKTWIIFQYNLEKTETLPLNETTGTWVTSVYNLWMESSSSFLLRARRTLTLKGTWLKRNNIKGEVSHHLSGTPVWLKILQNQQKWKLTQSFFYKNFDGPLNSILRVIRMETGWNLKILANIFKFGRNTSQKSIL